MSAAATAVCAVLKFCQRAWPPLIRLTRNCCIAGRDATVYPCSLDPTTRYHVPDVSPPSPSPNIRRRIYLHARTYRLTFSARFMCLARPARADKRPPSDVRHVSVAYGNPNGDEKRTDKFARFACWPRDTGKAATKTVLTELGSRETRRNSNNIFDCTCSTLFVMAVTPFCRFVYIFGRSFGLPPSEAYGFLTRKRLVGLTKVH